MLTVAIEFSTWIMHGLRPIVRLTLSMKLKPNQLVQIITGLPYAQGIHLKTFRLRGKVWHVVMLNGESTPKLFRLGSIECVFPKK